jgi:hypothetical protein
MKNQRPWCLFLEVALRFDHSAVAVLGSFSVYFEVGDGKSNLLCAKLTVLPPDEMVLEPQPLHQPKGCNSHHT